MASKRRMSKEEQNFIRFVKTCTDIFKLPLKDILASEIRPKDLYAKIQSSCLLTDRKNKLGSDQLKICYIPLPSIPDYEKFDVTLLYKLIRNLCPSLMPTQGWNVEPLNTDIRIGDDIERLRLFRNNCVHGSSTKILDSDFEDLWRNLESVTLRIQMYMTSRGYNPNYVGQLTDMKQLDLGDETIEDVKKSYILEHTYDRLKNNIDKPFIMISGSKKVFCGDTARFKVIVSPKDLRGWSVSWQKIVGDTSIRINLNKEKYSGSTDRELIIQSVCREDDGLYQALLSQESNGSNVKVLGNILCLETMGELPVFDLWKVTTGIEGINIHFKVKANMPFVYDINWTKDGETLNYGSKKYNEGSLEKGYLTITSPNAEDRGIYTCMVKNAVGTVHQEVKFDFPSVQIISNEPVFFGCKGKISPSNIASCPSLDGVKWQKSSDGKTFDFVDTTETKYYGSSLDSESPLLVLPSVKFEDKLYYRLLAWNKIGEQYSNMVHLNVTGSRPNIVVNHRTYIKNNSIKLIGTVFPFEKSLAVKEVFWTRNREKIDTQGSGGKYSKVSVKNPSLTIFGVNKHDAGSYQLTAINVVGSTKSDDIILGVPNVFMEEKKDMNDGSQYFVVEIESIPTPCNVQWCTQSMDDDCLEPIDVNSEEYRGSTNCLPHPVLALRGKDQLKKKCFKIKVTNFVGSTVLDVISGENNSAVYEMIGEHNSAINEKIGEKNSAVNKRIVAFKYRDEEVVKKIRFANLCSYLARYFPPEELENLKYVLRSSEKVQNMSSLMDAESVWTCLSILQDELLFTKEDVTFMQWLCIETHCPALNEKCIDYAKKQGTIFFSEKPPEEGFTNIKFHVKGDLNGYTKEDIQNIVKTVAAMLDCEENDIFVHGVLHSTSFILILSMRKSFTQKLSVLNAQDCLKLQKLNIDSLSLNGKTITLESIKEHWDNDANINKKGNFQKDDQEQNTNSGESYFTERDYSSDLLEPTDNDTNINEKGNFQKDDQEQITNYGESYFTEWDFSSDFLEPTDNDANTNEKGSFKKDDQEQKTNSDESYFTDWKYSSENLTCDDKKELFGTIQKGVVRTLQGEKSCLLKLIPVPVVRKHFTLTEFKRCSHISFANLDYLYINEGIKLILSNTSGETKHYFENIRNDSHAGSHTTSRNDVLFYIDPKYNIIKMTINVWKTKTTFIKCVEKTDYTWRPWCIYCSSITEDLLVGMKKYDRLKGRIIRYNRIGQTTQKIQTDEMGCDIYSTPRYITENMNGDVVVSDSTGVLVVTDHNGRHRFSYKGQSPESKLSPLGICTDALLHILVCDELTHAVQVLDKDGQFLSNLLIKPSDLVSPSCLCYDFKTDLLCVGSNVNNSVCLYKYLTSQDAITDESPTYVDETKA